MGRIGNVIGVLGTTGGSGKSTLCLALAHQLSRLGRVVVVDADESVSALGMLAGSLGVGAEALAGCSVIDEERAERVASPLFGLGYWLVRGAGSPGERRGEMGEQFWADTVRALRQRFDYVIVDSSTLSVSRTQIEGMLLACCDHVILCCSDNSVARARSEQWLLGTVSWIASERVHPVTTRAKGAGTQLVGGRSPVAVIYEDERWASAFEADLLAFGEYFDVALLELVRVVESVATLGICEASVSRAAG